MQSKDYKIDISVIIPVYNVEQYLRRCIDSVLKQCNILFEVIIVDDGSTDKSSQICDYYKNMDSRIKVVHKKNEGLGYARNTGIDIAKGKYIFFLDSDDWIPNNALLELYDLAEREDADIVEFSLLRTCEMIPFSVEQPQEIIQKLQKNEIIKLYAMEKIHTTACNKLYKKIIFDNVRFTNVKIHEDAYSMHLFLNEASSAIITNKIYYVQYVRPYSIMQSEFRKENFISLECGERFLQFVNKKYPEYYNEAKGFVIHRQYSLVFKAAEDGAYIEYKKQIDTIIKNINDELAICKSTLKKRGIYSEIVKLCMQPKRFILKTYLKKKKSMIGQLLRSKKR